MREFVLHIHDDRYTVATLAFVEAEDEPSALRLALGLLRESPHHTAIDVVENDEPLFQVERALEGGQRPPTAPRQSHPSV